MSLRYLRQIPALRVTSPRRSRAPTARWATLPPAVAALAMLAFLAAVFVWIDRDTARSYSTGIGEQRTIQLADG